MVEIFNRNHFCGFKSDFSISTYLVDLAIDMDIHYINNITMKKILGLSFVGIVLCVIVLMAKPDQENTLKITPYEAKLDDLVQMLEIKMWKIRLKVPEEGIWMALEVRKNGETNKFSGIGIAPGGGTHEYLLAIYPLGGTMTEADKLRVLFRSGNGGGGGAVKSFCKGNGSTLYYYEPKLLADGSHLLMEYNDNNNDPFNVTNNTFLVFTLKKFPRKAANH